MLSTASSGKDSVLETPAGAQYQASAANILEVTGAQPTAQASVARTESIGRGAM